MSEEWMERKQKQKREHDLVLEDKLYGTIFWVLICSAIISLNLYLHGFRFGF